MAIINPEIDVIKRQKVKPTEGEKALLNFLWKYLDDSYEIFYQPYINGDNPDIAVMRKGSGVLLIEVKDWNLQHYYCDESTRWRLLNDNTPLKSPLKQVDNYKDNLFNLHIEELHKRHVKNKKHWATVNCVVYFHNAKESELRDFLLKDFQQEKYERYRKFINYFGLLGSDSLNKQKLDSLLSKFWMNRNSRYFDDELYKSFIRYLKSPIHQIEEGREIVYSREQKELIRSEERPRRKIKGVAGSGKTLVLAKRAVNAHIRTESKVLILTYNLSLKNYIHDRISDVREEFYWSNFYITNYHQFFKTQANNYNLEISNLSAWQDINFFESQKEVISKYDVVLIDEIQDYLQAWIDIVTKYFTHDNTEFVVFGDEKQNIYNRELDENNEPIVRTISGKWNKSLNTSHRFSSNIGNIALKFQREIFRQKYTADDIKFISQLDFKRRIIEYHFFKSIQPKIVLSEIYNLLEKNLIHSSDTGVLSSKVDLIRELDYLIRTEKNEKTSTTFESHEEYEKIQFNPREIERVRRFKKNHFWMKTGTVKLSTIHSFKGWEIDTLFLLIDNDEKEDKETNAELIYTALTRARNNLIIFNMNNRIYDNFFRNEIQNCYEHE